MDVSFDQALDDVLSSWQEGQPLADCLARYPEYRQRLLPLLEIALSAAENLNRVEAPSHAALVEGRRRFLQHAAGRPARRRFGPAWAQPSAAGALAMLMFLLFAGGLMASTWASLPGSALYPLKRFAENAQLWLTMDPGARARLQDEFRQERREEVRAVLQAGRPATVQFEGVLAHFDPSVWVIDGLFVVLDKETVMEGEPFIGSVVLVSARALEDGRLLARHLQVAPPTVPPSPSAMPSPTATAPATAAPTRTPTPAPSDGPRPTRAAPDQLTDVPQPAPSRPPRPTATHVPTHTATHPPAPSDTPHAGPPAVTPSPEPSSPPTATRESPGATPTGTGSPPGSHTPQPPASPGPPATRGPNHTRTPNPSRGPQNTPGP